MVVKTVVERIVDSDLVSNFKYCSNRHTETNLLEGKILSEGPLGSCSRLETWKPISHKELLGFLGSSINMGLIIKRSTNTF